MLLTITPRLSLTEFREDDRQVCVERIGDPAIYKATLRIPRPYTPSDYDRWMEILAEEMERHGEPTHFAIREDGSLIGGIGFESLRKGHCAEVGYWLARPWWGRGIMTAVVGEACRMAETHWDLVRISAHVFSWNTASARVLEKNGFAYEGLLRKLHIKDGQFLDARLFARVR